MTLLIRCVDLTFMPHAPLACSGDRGLPASGRRKPARCAASPRQPAELHVSARFELTTRTGAWFLCAAEGTEKFNAIFSAENYENGYKGVGHCLPHLCQATKSSQNAPTHVNPSGAFSLATLRY